MPYRNLPGARFTVIATGRQGVIVGATVDDYLRVILDGVDAVTEFQPHELDIDRHFTAAQSEAWVEEHTKTAPAYDRDAG